jgi:hypothetical protein
MNTKPIRYRLTLLTICLILVATMVAAAIPQPAQAAPPSDPYLTYNAWIDKGKVHLDINSYPAKAKYQVKLRDIAEANKSYKVGTIRLAKNTAQSFTYALPKALAKTLYVQVCLKNLTNDKLNCKIVINPGT